MTARGGGIAVLLLALSIGCGRTAGDTAEPQVVETLPWTQPGVWLVGDPHVHWIVDHADISAVVTDAAAKNGLDFVALTEHAQTPLEGRFAPQLAQLRERHSELIVLAGTEWNMPAAHHAVVLTDGTPGEVQFLDDFASAFDRKVNLVLKLDAADEGTWGTLEQAAEGIAWLRERGASDGPRSAVYLAHPSRHTFPTAEQIAALAAAGLHGIEAAPGHQDRERPGIPTSIDRYDPYIAEVGGDYDRLIASGGFLGLSAGSDYHHDEGNFRPGQFSRSFVLCPERSAAGVVAGLAAGATVTVLGGIVDAVDVHLVAGDAAARIGEVLAVPVGSTVTVTVTLDVPDHDFAGQPNRLDQLELIADIGGSARSIHSFGRSKPGRDQALRYALPRAATAKPGAFFVRLVGRRKIGRRGNDRDNADYLLYTAPTRVRVVNQRP